MIMKMNDNLKKNLRERDSQTNLLKLLSVGHERLQFLDLLRK